jgi:acyl-CoA reductase-like NAD-dependent aldehyde dehydrogenase
VLAGSGGAGSGNAVIIKPSELTTLTTLQIRRGVRRPAERPGAGDHGGGAAGGQLVEHPDTHMVAFTGGIETGRRIAETCARLYKRSLIETSGNDPFIVMPSAPLDTRRAARRSAHS